MRTGVHFLAVIILTVASKVAADSELIWIGASYEESAWLSYAMPQTDWGVISFHCGRATRKLSVSYVFEPVDAEDGMTFDMELMSEGGQVVLHAVGERFLLDDAYILTAKTNLSPELHAVLFEGQTLTIMVQDGVDEIPLDGIITAAGDLIEACGCRH